MARETRYAKTPEDVYIAYQVHGHGPVFDGPARAVRCATAIAGNVHRTGIDVRAGLHTGELELAEHDIRGTAVNIAARVAGEAGPGEALVSSTVKDLVAGLGLQFMDRGIHTLKGVPEPWHLYAVSPN